MPAKGAPRPKKSLGQHFLKNPETCGRIVAMLACGPQDNIIEIGPGPGALTDFLQKAPHNRLVLLEKDYFWARERARNGAITIVMDALGFNWRKPQGRWKIIGNLPYNVASPLIWDILSQCDSLVKAVFMVQKEVALRLAATPGQADYGGLSVWAQSFAKPVIEMNLAPASFYPPPKVDSAVVSFTPRRVKPDCPHELNTILKICFQQRRKQLGGILRRAGLARLLEMSGEFHIDPGARPQELDSNQFQKLATALRALRQA